MVYLSLGSNLGNKEDNLLRAVELLEERVGHILRRSAFFYSEPWGFVSDNSFVNICVALETRLSPIDLLHATQQIESDMGRVRKRQKEDGAAKPAYEDRIIDIDILLYNGLTIHSPELQIPHPLMQQRDFVMTPLREIMTP